MPDAPHVFHRRSILWQAAGASIGLCMASTFGCSKMLVSSGKVLFGDPKLPSEFTTLTKEDLTKGLKTILVVCTAVEGVEDEVSTVKLDVIDGVTRRMRLQGVKVINPERVIDWIDDHGGIVSNPHELAKDFDTDYIAWIDVQTYNLHEPNSPKLLRGQTSGFIRVFKIEEHDGQRLALRIYEREFALTYPQHQPISEQGRGLEVFQKDYMKNLCDMLAERFYDHRPGTKF
ncbi:hypothetical protein [Schlesneria paludicola]|uniref:hypothetical protein n=1 Tax=Schlesneria paludicola TaxID=360056 RepID=UPI00029B16D5|nr:hypothetical protein [Schlesneria paludicola]